MHEEKILRQNLFGDLGLTDLANKLASEPYGSSSPVFIPAALDIDIWTVAFELRFPGLHSQHFTD